MYLLLTWECLFAVQMCDDNPFVVPEMEPSLCRQIQECNWQVVNVTTLANYFHVLRRQVSLFLMLAVQHIFLPSYLNVSFTHTTSESLDTWRLPEAINCDDTQEPTSTQGLQVQPFRL